MKTWNIEGQLLEDVRTNLMRSPWFRELDADALQSVISIAVLQGYQANEVVVQEGDPSDSFYLLIKGELIVEVSGAGDQPVEVGRVHPPYTFGEIGLLLGKPRTATLLAADKVLALNFGADVFQQMFDNVHGFRLNLVRSLATRVDELSQAALPAAKPTEHKPGEDMLRLLPIGFIQRHRVLPLRHEGNLLTVGFVDDPTPQALAGLRQQLPGMQLRPVRIVADHFNEVLSSTLGTGNLTGGFAAVATSEDDDLAEMPKKLKALLERAVAEGASDLHLCAGRRPLWRVDGDIVPVRDASPMGNTEVLSLLEPVLEERSLAEFEERNDADFALSAAGLGRFRVNLYRTSRGVGAALRQIPFQIRTLDQLGMPKVLKTFCYQPKGLVLVTGPTGSGKSTTLAAMIDFINETRQCHIVTLEDPVEFIHEDKKALVNQREIGSTVESFSRGLRAALREDPDVVLLGEIRDGETANLALEIANTGHLVFGTLHTNSATTTVERLIDMFPPEVQNQSRSTLSDVLRGVVCQTLLKKRGGGRVAAVEVLVSSRAAANLIREGRPNQLVNVMQTRAQEGNKMLNEDLARLVSENQVMYDEALSKAVEKDELARRLGRLAT